MPKDVAELDKYLNENGWIILADRMLTKKPIILESLLHKSSYVKYITQPSFLEQISINYIESRKEFKILEISSPVVEFMQPIFISEQNKLKRGRLYIDYNKLTNFEKASEFQESIKKMFSWFKKQFPNTKINSSWTTEATKRWLTMNKGSLITFGN